MPLKQVIAMGGGGFSMEPENPLLDVYIMAQARKKTPSVCFFPHATDDAPRYCFNFYKAFSRFDARLSTLSLFTPHTADLESFLLAQDVIYVGGGNTRSMLALWREWGLDRILRKAYEEGVVLAGISAGANCWFEQCSTDSVPGKLSVMDCTGTVFVRTMMGRSTGVLRCTSLLPMAVSRAAMPRMMAPPCILSMECIALR
jgi:dipeptidase E